MAGGSILPAALLLAGCSSGSGPPKPQAPSFRGISLKVGAIDDPAILTGVRCLARRVGSIPRRPDHTGGKPLAAESSLQADVVIFPGNRLGDLVDAEALAVIPNSAVMPARPPESESGERATSDPPSASDQENKDVRIHGLYPRLPRAGELAYGDDRFALPCGASALVLAYRRDAFESDANRAAAEGRGIELKPPKTWSELDALARFFAGRDWNGDGRPDARHRRWRWGLTPKALGDAAFLARAASLGQHRDHFSFLFDSDAFTPRVEFAALRRSLERHGGLEGVRPSRRREVRCGRRPRRHSARGGPPC